MKPGFKLALKWGSIGGILAAIVGLIFHFLGIMVEKQFLYYIIKILIVIGIILFASYELKDKNNEGSSFKELFVLGLQISFVFGTVVVAWELFYFNFINLNYIAENMVFVRERMEEWGLDEIQIQQAMQNADAGYKLPRYSLNILFYTLLGGFVSLLSALVLRKRINEEQIIQQKLEEQE